jgi:hypothetical protein
VKGTRRALASAAVIWILVAPSRGLAQAEDQTPATKSTSPQDRAIAEALFRDAKKLGDEGKIAQACAKFEESQRLDPAVGTLLHLGACYETEGRTASAWAAYGGARVLAERAQQRDRAQLASERAAELEKRLSQVVIAVAEPAEGMLVFMDGRPLREAMFSTPLPVDPGKHGISVQAPGKRIWTHKFELGAGPNTLTVNIPPLEDVQEDRRSAPKAAPRQRSEPAAPKSESRTNTTRIAGFALGGVGLAAIGIGSYFGLRAASQASDADKHCNGSLCTQEGLDGHDSASTSALISTIGFGVGIAGIAGGTYLVLTSSSAPAPHSSVGSFPAGGYFFSARGEW